MKRSKILACFVALAIVLVCADTADARGCRGGGLFQRFANRRANNCSAAVSRSESYQSATIYSRSSSCSSCTGSAVQALPMPAAIPPAPSANCVGGRCALPVFGVSASIPESSVTDEVNQLRAARGLRPYQCDPGLVAAAQAAAAYRAQHRLAGHVMGGMGDFQFLPSGTTASTAGCAAWPPGMGFGACAVYDNYTYCGAATVQGPDGLNYHHAFYR